MAPIPSPGTLVPSGGRSGQCQHEINPTGFAAGHDLLAAETTAAPQHDPGVGPSDPELQSNPLQLLHKTVA